MTNFKPDNTYYSIKLRDGARAHATTPWSLKLEPSGARERNAP